MGQLIDPSSDHTQTVLRDRLSQHQHLLADLATLQHQNHENLATPGGDQFQVLQAGVLGMQRSDERGSLGLVSQDRGCKTHPFIHIVARLVKLVLDGALDVHGQVRAPHQLAYEVAVALLGGYSTSRSVRLAQVTGIGQRCHLIAHGGRTEIQVVFFHQVDRTDRLDDFHVLADDQC